MATEAGKDNSSRDPIQVKLGEEFKPFEGIHSLDDLVRSRTTDCLFEQPFFLQNIGLGRVAILGHESLLDEDQEGNFLDLSKSRPRLFHIIGPIGRLAADIRRMPESIVTEPNLICILRLEGGEHFLELTSVGTDTTLAANEGPAFLWFSRRATEEPKELIIDAAPANLRKIILKFDTNR